MQPDSPYRFDMAAYIAKHRNPVMDPSTAAHEARVRELLKANTRFEQDARDARAASAKLQRALSQIVERIGIAETEKVKEPEAVQFGEKPSQAILDIVVERRRQRLYHGYSAAHDDEHVDHALLRSAASRVLRLLADWNQALKPKLRAVAESLRPWSETATAYRKTLIQAAALIVAEVERHDRMLARMDAEDGASPVPTPHTPVITNTPRMARCNVHQRAQNPPPAFLPRSCPECGLGPCKFTTAVSSL